MSVIEADRAGSFPVDQTETLQLEGSRISYVMSRVVLEPPVARTLKSSDGIVTGEGFANLPVIEQDYYRQVALEAERRFGNSDRPLNEILEDEEIRAFLAEEDARRIDCMVAISGLLPGLEPVDRTQLEDLTHALEEAAQRERPEAAGGDRNAFEVTVFQATTRYLASRLHFEGAALSKQLQN